MIKLFLFLSAFSLVAFCKEKSQINHNDVRFETEFYSALEYLLQNSFEKASVIVKETNPVFRSHWGNTKHPIGQEAVPPLFIVHYDWNTFQRYIDSMYLLSAESKSMIASIDSTKLIMIDPGMIHLPVISTHSLKEMFENNDKSEGYNIIERSFGGKCIVKASTPIFNSDFTKVILSIDYFCGGLNSYGYQFILEKKENGWKILNEIIAWST